MPTSPQIQSATAQDWVPETAFGKWFLSTQIWFRYVLTEAIVELKEIAGKRGSNSAQLLDIGCGRGLAFSLLHEHFKPKSIVGIDVDRGLLKAAEERKANFGFDVQLRQCSVTKLDLADGSVDTILCHQLLHHVADQEGALRELYRVLTPGGVLLLSESCREFIDTWPVRLLFRHPMRVQKSAVDYLALVRSMGFQFSTADVRESTPWWSQPDFGIARRLGIVRSRPATTELLVVAVKPA